ncbi:hypothetical protein AX17_006106 [Amanita inopinata Kibby_2008]|nr:hypothetical protein AX17_006106 [Amanita inopinata Kibby_2008]
MKRGRAAEQVNRWMEIQHKSGYPPFATWELFIEEFEKLFCPVNEQENTVIVLESSQYYQGQHMVEEYTDRFKDLIHQAGYTDSTAITVKYRRGLSPTIEAEITRATGCPTFQDTQGWYNVATQLDRA